MPLTWSRVGTPKLAHAAYYPFGLEKTVEGVVLSKGAGVVSNAVRGAGSTTLYRAVSGTEVADMAANGVRNIPSTVSQGYYEFGKLFATSAQDAAQFGKSNFINFGGGANTVVKVKVPKSVMKAATTFEADGMKTVIIPSNYLQQIKYIQPLNYSPKPTNPFRIPGW